MHKGLLKFVGILVGSSLLFAYLFSFKQSKTVSSENLKSSNAQTCQISEMTPTSCSGDKDDHAGSAEDTSHCQKHCGHVHAGLLSDANLNLTSPDSKKSIDSPEKTPENVILDPGSRPPNL